MVNEAHINDARIENMNTNEQVYTTKMDISQNKKDFFDLKLSSQATITFIHEEKKRIKGAGEGVDDFLTPNSISL